MSIPLRIFIRFAAAILVSDYRELPQAPLGMSHSIRYMHHSTSINQKIFLPQKQIWSSEFQVRDCGPVLVK